MHEEILADWSFMDDSTGKVLDAKKVVRTRIEELNTFKEMNVYEYVKRNVAVNDLTAKRIGVGWVGVEKASGVVRSR